MNESEGFPSGWAVAELSLFCEKIRGVSYSKEQASFDADAGLLPILRANNITEQGLTFNDLVYVPERCISQNQRIKKHDVVLAMSSGSLKVVGKAAQAEDDWDGGFGAFCGVLRAIPHIDSKYFGYFFSTQYYRQAISDLARGTNINNLKSEHFDQIDFPLPPLNEQRRIVAKLEGVLQRVESCRARLDSVPKMLKRFRQSVLAAACSGRLTADWREKNPDVEAASVLVENVRVERLARAKDKAARDRLSRLLDQNSSCEISYEIPDTWTACTFAHLFDVETGGTPFRKNSLYYKDGTIPWIKTGEVRNCDITQAEEFITELAVKETNVKIFPIGTILIAMYGEGKTRGQIGRLQIEAATNQACAALVNPDLNNITSDFVYLFCLSQYEKMRDEGRGGNQPNLNLSIIKLWTIPLPPLEEQSEIVRRVQQFFAWADSIEARYTKARSHFDKLTVSILAKAFRGELVPQDPNDEPAGVLLERIREQRDEPARNGSTPKPRGRKRSTPLTLPGMN